MSSSIRSVVFFVVLVAFSAFTFWVATHSSVVAFTLALPKSDPWTPQVTVDLLLMGSMAVVWMYGDSKKRGLPFVPFAVLTVFLGSIGLFTYLLVRERKGT